VSYENISVSYENISVCYENGVEKGKETTECYKNNLQTNTRTIKMKNGKTKICKSRRPDETAEVQQLRALRMDYYTILADTMMEGGSSEDIVVRTAARCRRAGLPEEPCVERTASLLRGWAWTSASATCWCPMLIGGRDTHKATFCRVRSDQYALLNRRASFIATTSAPRPLTDPTGSRRYLCCPVRRSSAWRRSTACS
jgi:hypothetical protein